jgi:membrane-associated protease RseP (regulator of RpoE activity)
MGAFSVMQSVLQFVVQYKWIFLFYLVIIFFLFVKRKRIVVQAKIIVLYRTLVGIRFIEYIAERFREWVKLWGVSGVGIGFIGMIVMSVLLLFNVVGFFFKPDQAAGVTLVLPGVELPGLGVLPFWYWLLAIFVIAVVHEFAHGIVAHAHNIKVKFTGLVLLGPIIGAFVEPDEKKLAQADDVVQYSVYAAGAWANVLTAVIALLLLNVVLMPVHSALVNHDGFTFGRYVDDTLPFARAGIEPGDIISGINGEKTATFQEFSEEFRFSRPGDVISVETTTGIHDVTLTAHPENPKRGFLGIFDIRNHFNVKPAYSVGLGNVFYSILDWFTGLESNGRGFLFWLYILSLGIGLFNLLPLPIVDGGRMVQTFLARRYGKERGLVLFSKVGIFFLLILAASFVLPFLF